MKRKKFQEAKKKKKIAWARTPSLEWKWSGEHSSFSAMFVWARIPSLERKSYLTWAKVFSLEQKSTRPENISYIFLLESLERDSSRLSKICKK